MLKRGLDAGLTFELPETSVMALDFGLKALAPDSSKSISLKSKMFLLFFAMLYSGPSCKFVQLACS